MHFAESTDTIYVLVDEKPFRRLHPLTSAAYVQLRCPHFASWIARLMCNNMILAAQVGTTQRRRSA